MSRSSSVYKKHRPTHHASECGDAPKELAARPYGGSGIPSRSQLGGVCTGTESAGECFPFCFVGLAGADSLQNEN